MRKPRQFSWSSIVKASSCESQKKPGLRCYQNLRRFLGRGYWILLVSGAALSSGCARSPSAVSYNRDVRPILVAYCLECHIAGSRSYHSGSGHNQNQFSVETYAEVIRGTKLGPVIIPGDPTNSTLIRAIEGKVDPRIQMPHGRGPLPRQDALTIRNWVAQGAKNN